VVTHRAEHEGADSAEPALAEDDHLGVVGVVEDRPAGRALGEGALDVGRALAGDGVDDLPQRLLRRLSYRLRVDRGDIGRARHRDRQQGAPGVHGANPGATQGCLVEGKPERLLGGVRSIDADDDHATTVPAPGCGVQNARAVIDLRSDTVTRPTVGMREAIAAAAVGDEQYREDPTVNELQERAAALLGQERALFLPTATMANQIALRLHTRPGDVLVAEELSHVLIYEFGGPAVHAGLITVGVRGQRGRLTAAQLEAVVGRSSSDVDQRAAVLSVENTHNSAGGTVWPLDELDAVIAVAHAHGLGVHLDGARLVNAAVAQGVAVAELGSRCDTVTLCLSKGLGCPLGAILAGPDELMERAWREKHLFGGAMRQAGIVAAAGLYALDHHVDRLADDHARARRLAGAWHAAGVPVDLEQVQTNFVQIDVAPLGLGRREALDRLRAAGVGVSATVHETVIRAVTHLDIGDDDVERAIELVPKALGAGDRAGG